MTSYGPSRVPGGGGVAIGLEPVARPRIDQRTEIVLAGRGAPAARQQQREGGVGVHAMTHRIVEPGQIVAEAARERPRERPQGIRPASRRGERARRYGLVEREQPSPPVWPLEGRSVRLPEIDEFTRDRRGAQVAREEFVRAIGAGELGMPRQQRDDQPVLVDRRVPVEAAVERRVQRTRASVFTRTLEDVVRLVGELALDVVERLREPSLRARGVEPTGGRGASVGRIGVHRRSALLASRRLATRAPATRVYRARVPTQARSRCRFES